MSVTSEEDMATLAADNASTSPPFHRRRKSWARRVERICCQTLSYFPLTFVYGLTTWAIWVEVQIAFLDHEAWIAYPSAIFGIAFYLLANISYTIAVFTPPGSPLDKRGSKHTRTGDYEGLPTHEDEDEAHLVQHMSNVTAKSTGKQRYCKKCRTLKPDRTHHCSTCKQCVLKMDHHCPWLATCVGLHNYKAFLLFLMYTCLLCYVCFAVSMTWVWSNILETIAVDDGWRLVHTIMLAVLSGIIGLVLSGFTGWHLWLATTGATTIESLEKTRYLSPVRKSMERQFQQERTYLGQEQSTTGRLREIHANALPGVLRDEEGEVQTTARPSARDSLQRSYASLEHQREHDRYESYLDERDSEKLPNAFDLGWRRNLLHLFGDKPLLWAMPVCNTTGDGWQWEVSEKWVTARDIIARERAQRQRQNARWDQHNTSAHQSDLRWVPGVGFAPPPRADSRQSMPMQPLDRRKEDDTSIDEESRQTTTDWNDIPDDLLTAGSARSSRSRSQGRNKHD